MDRQGPYVVRAVVGHPERADAVNLIFRGGDEGPYARVGMGETKRGIFEASIPGQPAFTLVRYYIEVVDGDSVVTDPPAAVTSQEFFAFWVLGGPCTNTNACAPAEYCDASGVCRSRGGPCTLDSDCGKGFRCFDSRCRLAARSCTGDFGCLLGEVCDGLLGECIPRPRCDEGLDCPLGFACDESGGVATCRRQCAGDSECLPGEGCDGRKLCASPQPCNGPGSCAAPLVCDPLLSLCRLQGAPPCAPCATDADCGGGNDHCLVLGGALRCGKDCSLNGCPAGYSCDAALALPQCRPSGGRCTP